VVAIAPIATFISVISRPTSSRSCAPELIISNVIVRVHLVQQLQRRFVGLHDPNIRCRDGLPQHVAPDPSWRGGL
jgi:hypothetical protein